MTNTPNFSEYTYLDLIDALENIDREQYPDRLEMILKELEIIESRFPYVKVPTNDLVKCEQPKGFWGNLKSLFDLRNPTKKYGYIEAQVRRGEGEDDYYQPSIVSAVLEDDKGSLSFVLEGGPARIKINASNIVRLKTIIEEAERDLASNINI